MIHDKICIFCRILSNSVANEDKENKQSEDLPVLHENILKAEGSSHSNNNLIESKISADPTESSSGFIDSLSCQQAKINPLPLINSDLNLPFTIGDLVWAYISGYPLWPSLITQDPVDSLYSKTRSKFLFCFIIYKFFFQGISKKYFT